MTEQTFEEQFPDTFDEDLDIQGDQPYKYMISKEEMIRTALSKQKVKEAIEKVLEDRNYFIEHPEDCLFSTIGFKKIRFDLLKELNLNSQSSPENKKEIKKLNLVQVKNDHTMWGDGKKPERDSSMVSYRSLR